MLSKLFRTLFSLLLASTVAMAHAETQTYATYPPVDYSSKPNAEQLKRGEYLTKMGDCIACHTTKGGKSFAGGLAITTPFGTIYTPNITSDPNTGIGRWTDEQFIKAMREGISPQGHYYYPAFPYLYFSILTDDDLKAIKAYLDAIPTVNQPNRENDMMFPFNWRFLQLGWRLLFFHPEKPSVYQPDSKQSDSWNRGKYLVDGLGHCAMCHTPSYYLFSEKYSLAAPRKKYDLTGAIVEGYFAPNITSTLMANVSTQELSDVFLKDQLIGGGKVEGPMLEANRDSLQYLKSEDIEAIATYLRSVKSENLNAGKGSSKGEKTYNQYCTGCHATGAGGAPKVGDGTAWTPLIKQGMTTLYKNAINGINGMPAKGTCTSCTDQDIQEAVDYMVHASEGHHGGGATGGGPQMQTPLTMEDGKKLYNTYCSACHNPNTNYPNAPKIGDQPAWAPIIQQGVDVVIWHAIDGYGTMAPRGGCTECNDAQIKAAVKYLIQNSQTGKDYSLW